MIDCRYCKHHSFNLWYDPTTGKDVEWEDCLLNRELYLSECDEFVGDVDE